MGSLRIDKGIFTLNLHRLGMALALRLLRFPSLVAPIMMHIVDGWIGLPIPCLVYNLGVGIRLAVLNINRGHCSMLLFNWDNLLVSKIGWIIAGSKLN